jgi:chromosome partitioning protein
VSNCKIFAIANQKGGVGKTTTACNMGYALLEMGKKVLCVDFDPQANLSMCVGIERPDEVENTMTKLLSLALEDEISDIKAFIQTVNGIDIIPSSIALTETELNLRNEVGGQTILKHILDPLRDEYDTIIIDTNPYLGILTINALSACDEVIIPASPHLWSATGLTDLIGTITKVKKKINKGISIKGILFTICDGNTKLFK